MLCSASTDTHTQSMPSRLGSPPRAQHRSPVLGPRARAARARFSRAPRTTSGRRRSRQTSFATPSTAANAAISRGGRRESGRRIAIVCATP